MARRTWLIGGVAVAAVIAAGAGVASATGTMPGGDTDIAITGDALTKASEAALRHVGQRRVTETEVGDEDSLYEVEVTLSDGTQVDVQLDDQFRVVNTKKDHEDGNP
jgi:hypothetical protein